MKNIILSLLFSIIAFVPPAEAALSSATVFELRTGGSDNNSGGYVTGSTGTDFSQQAAAQFSGTNLASANGSTNPCIVTSATHNFTSTDVGDTIHVTAGTNWTAGIYQIVSTATNAATLDRACGSTASISGGTWTEGGALASPATLIAQLTVTGMQAYVQNGVYTVTTGITTSAGSSPSAGIIRVIGYNTVRGDTPTTTATQPTWAAGAAAITLLTEGQGGYRFENITFDGNTRQAYAVTINGNYTTFFNDIFQNWNPTTNWVIALNGSGDIVNQCLFTANGGSVSTIYIPNSSELINSMIVSNTTTGFGVIQTNAFNAIILNNIVANNNGTHGLGNDFIMPSVIGNIFYNNNGDGVRNTSNYSMDGIIENNIFASNSGFGLNMSVMSPVRSDVSIGHNGYFNNTSGATSGVNTGIGDVILTANPFTLPGANNFALNATTGGGAALRQAGYPGLMPGGASTGFQDIGALQAAAPTLGYVSGF